MITIAQAKKYVKLFFQRADIFLLVLCLICAAISVFAVDHTTHWLAEAGVKNITPTKMVIVQVFSVFLGIGAFVLFTIIDADILGEQWRWLILIILLLLIQNMRSVRKARRLIAATETDALTGLYTRDYFFEYANRTSQVKNNTLGINRQFSYFI